MQKIYYYIAFFLVICIGCEQENTTAIPSGKETYIQISVPASFRTRVVDEDNLASEQTINNLSLFFTEPSTTAIIDKYIHAGFTLSGDYRLITLPVEPADLSTKDIYVVANYNDENTLTGITSINELTTLMTPEVDKTNNLNPLNGFCMSGSTLNFNFNDGSGAIATIGLVRTCAKYRVNVTFPDNPALSTNNSFLIQQAARYTFVNKNPTAVLPVSDYFTFAAPIPLVETEGDVYSNNTYLYEASMAPILTIYTYINNSAEPQEFTTTLPIPQRNYLYDLSIRIYEDTESVTRSNRTDNSPGYRLEYMLTTHVCSWTP